MPQITYAYSNNGLSFRAVASDYVAQPGEVVFSGMATSDQLNVAFTGYAAAAAALIASAAAQNALVAGVAIESVGTSTLNSTYSITPQAIGLVNAVVSSILATGNFPNGETSYTYLDPNGSAVEFESTAAFQAIAAAIAKYVDAVTKYLISGGTVGSLPSTPVQIA